MTEKLRLDIPIILPAVQDASDACVARLLSNLQAQHGVERVHVDMGIRDGPAQLCVHYDPAILALSRIRTVVKGVGAEITERYGHAVWQVDIPHQRRARTIAERLRRLPGVIEAEASAGGIVRLEFDRSVTSEVALQDAFSKEIGRAARPLPARDGKHADDFHAPHKPERAHERDWGEHGHSHHEGGFFGTNTELIFSLVCGALLSAGYLIAKLFTVPLWLPFAFYLAAYFFGGFFTLREAVDNLRLGRFEIDMLMLVAAAGASLLGVWAEGALLLFLFSLGHALEHCAMGRAKRAIEALAELAPRTALVRRNGEIQELAVEELAVGDIVIVRPDSRLWSP